MENNLTNEESFIELTGNRAEEVSKYWKVEILEGENKQLHELNYAIRLTSTLNGVSITFSKANIDDNAQSKQIVRRLSGFGKIKASYIKVISESVNDALYSQHEKILKVSDISSVWTDNIFSGVSAEKYYKKFYKHFIDNQELFPTRSSNKYQHEVSHGAILDNKKTETSNLRVAIRSGKLKKLFSVKSDNQYHEVLESLVDMGVLEGELLLREVEVVEVKNSSTEGSRSIKEITRHKRNRRDKRVTMNTKGQEANVYIFKINLEKGE